MSVPTFLMPRFPTDFPSLPDLPTIAGIPRPVFPDLPPPPSGRKATAQGKLPRGVVVHVRNEQFPKVGGDGGESKRIRRTVTAEKMADAAAPGAQPATLPKLNVKSNFATGAVAPYTPTLFRTRPAKEALHSLATQAAPPGRSSPRIGLASHRKPKDRALLGFGTDSSNEPAVQIAVPSKKTRKSANIRVSENRKRAINRLAQLPLPASQLDKEKLQNEIIRKKLVLSEIKKEFGGFIQINDVILDDQGKVSSINVQAKNLKSSKWVDLKWQSGTPMLKNKIQRLHDVTTASWKHKWNSITMNINTYDKFVALDPSVDRPLRLRRAVGAIKMASAFIRQLPGNASSTFLRGGFQSLKYNNISDPVSFKEAYASSQLAKYFEGKDERYLLSHMDALLVEAYKDVRQIVAGCVSPEQMIELINLFPENPLKTDVKDWVEVNEDNKGLIKSHLKEILGEYYQLVAGMFCLMNDFQKQALTVLKDPSLVALSKNYWRANMLLFGLANEQFEAVLGEVGTDKSREFGRRRSMWAFHLTTHADEYFKLDA